MRNVHNRISLDSFFEVGGRCRIYYSTKKEVCKYAEPKSVEEFNNIMEEALWPRCSFFWNRWEYRPDVKVNEDGLLVFRYLIATNKTGIE